MEAVFTFHDTHSAVTGEKTLLEGGVMVRIMSLPSSLGAGCGLCLRVNMGDLDKALGLLNLNRIKPQGVYEKTRQDGQTLYHSIEMRHQG